MTPADLAAIEARCAAATPLPWEAHAVSGNPVVAPCPCCGLICNCIMEDDQRFIAHARTDVPALLAEVRRLLADNERMQRGLEYISKRGPGSVDGECTDCESQCVDQARAAVNLLAGREWNESEGK